ncbi:response regulator [Sulfurimonas sp. MAG313]|nr:response regulator [Sulfurimonas sp. MAG313]MDF1880736.1 response regulator [Sulfurimonas sp. MAG313]
MQNINSMREYTQALNVLYVEDNEDLRQYIQELLSLYFKNIDLVSNGQEAVKQYLKYKEANQDYYDLVITDINMPGISGIDMSADIIEINPSQKIIITTGYNNIEYLQRAIDIGVDSFVTKPIRKNQFLQVLSKVSQAIVDHKFVISHVANVEKLNLRLENMNNKLELQNLELIQTNCELKKSFRMLDTMVSKEQLHYEKNLKETEECDLIEEKYIYEQVELLISTDLHELIEIHTIIDVNIINILNEIDNINPEVLSTFSSLFKRYSSTLAFYNFFDELSSSMVSFSNVIQDNPLPTNKESVLNIFMLIESFVYVLGKWQTYLSSSDINKINSLDASMISDMETIINMWTQNEIEVTECEMDDIFDF